eukprot:6442581-Pyramimonas_sp.AAC.1
MGGPPCIASLLIWVMSTSQMCRLRVHPPLYVSVRAVVVGCGSRNKRSDGVGRRCRRFRGWHGCRIHRSGHLLALLLGEQAAVSLPFCDWCPLR